jgi:hypothetical protein
MDNTNDTRSSLQVEKFMDYHRETLRDLKNRGFVTPTYKAKGQGTRSAYTRTDCYALELFRELTLFGLDRPAAAKIVKQWRSELKQIESKPQDEVFQTDTLLFRCEKKGKKNIHIEPWNFGETLNPKFPLQRGGTETISYKLDIPTGEVEVNGYKAGPLNPKWDLILVVRLQPIKARVDEWLKNAD